MNAPVSFHKLLISKYVHKLICVRSIPLMVQSVSVLLIACYRGYKAFFIMRCHRVYTTLSCSSVIHYKIISVLLVSTVFVMLQYSYISLKYIRIASSNNPSIGIARATAQAHIR
jgi:hypothetical protein